MPDRWTSQDLAERIAANPSLRVKRENRLESPQKRGSHPSRQGGSKPAEPQIRLNGGRNKRKYRNRPVVLNGLRFDSGKEARRFGELDLLRRAHEIRDLERQVKFELGINGIKVCAYICDFRYYEKPQDEGADWRLVVEDVKSAATRKLPTYRIKRKLMKAIYGIEIRET